MDVLTAATLWHDYGKIWDYRKNPNYGKEITDASGFAEVENGEIAIDRVEHVYTRHRWTIRHLTRSYHEFMSKAEEYQVDADLAEQVSHAILSHHGRMAWGSPVEPLTPEALILHQADMLSAYHTEGEHLFKRPVNGDWKDVKL